MAAAQVQLVEGTRPGSPAGTSGAVYYNSANQRLEFIDKNGNIYILGDSSIATKPNLISNSSLKFWQLQTPGSYANTVSSAVNRNYGLWDRWAGTTQNGTMGARRIDAAGVSNPGLLSRYYADIVKNTGSGKQIISTGLPAQLSVPLKSTVVSFSVKLKLGVGTDWTNTRIGLMAYSGTADSTSVTFLSGFNAGTADASLVANYAYCVPYAAPIGGTMDSQGISVTVTGSWVKYGGLFTIPSTCNNLVAAVWSRDQLAANTVLFMAEPMLHQGADLLDWTPPIEELEYVDCARYVQKSMAIDVAPAQSLGTGTGEYRFIAGLAGALAEKSNTITFSPRMRATPTLTAYNPNALNAQVRDQTAAADCSAQAFSGATDAGFQVTATGNAATLVGNALAVHYLATCEIL